jgi:DNA topoisomerase-3
MVHLVSHFGDEDDSGAPCGLCDICAPGETRALSLLPADAEQLASLVRLVARLRERNGQASGKLHREVFGESLERKSFEALIGALVRAGLAVEESDSFDKDGETISFARVRLTRAGLEASDSALAEVRVAREIEPERAPRRRKKKSRSRGRPTPNGVKAAEPDGALYLALAQWRNAEAKRRRIPAFRIMSNATLAGIAASRPRDERELLAVKGIGPALAAKFGETLLELVRARE